MSLKKGVGSGSVSQRYRSADPDPHQDVTDPQHCLKQSVVDPDSCMYSRSDPGFGTSSGSNAKRGHGNKNESNRAMKTLTKTKEVKN